MCGIAGIYRRTDTDIPELNKFADALLWGIASRGEDATGYVTVDDEGAIQLEKVPVAVGPFVNKRRRMRADTRTVLLHTRWATVGHAHDPRNAHPVSSGDCYAVHNGTINNASDLFKTFGLSRSAEVDSEVIPALIDFAGWGHVGTALGLMSGGAATAVINAAEPRDLILAKVRDYPLVYVVANDFIVWASTASAINFAWKRIFGRTPKAKRIKNLTGGEMLHAVDGKITMSKFEVKQQKWPTRSTLMAWEDTWLDDDELVRTATWTEIKPGTWARVAAPVHSARASAITFGLVGEDVDWGDVDDDEDEDEGIEDNTLDVVGSTWCDDCGEWSSKLVAVHDSCLCPECAADYIRTGSVV